MGYVSLPESSSIRPCPVRLANPKEHYKALKNAISQLKTKHKGRFVEAMFKDRRVEKLAGGGLPHVYDVLRVDQCSFPFVPISMSPHVTTTPSLSNPRVEKLVGHG